MSGPKNPLEMSDEEISAMNAPPEAPASGESDQGGAPAEQPGAGEEAPTEAELAAEAEAEGSDAGDSGDGDGDGDGEKSDTEADTGDTDTVEEKPDADPAGEAKPGEEAKPAEGDKLVPPIGSKPKADGEGEAPVAPVDRDKPDAAALASFYNQIMTPFKANGKTIELKDPKEAIQLMQMGANYTRKLQDLQPHRKMLMMLQNNGLLDEGKLTYLIDLDKKNPEAIKKLVKESGIDPLDIDPAENVTYRPGNHGVTDEEMGFRTTMEELISSDPDGKETVSEIYDNWDDASKDVLWKQPDILNVMHEQRQSGVYDLIKAEVDRRITLGQIPPNTPFLESYKVVGDEMVEQAKSAGGGGAPAQRDVVAKRAAAPRSKVANGDKASAASPTRASPKATGDKVNPLALSDEQFNDQFLKNMEGRL